MWPECKCEIHSGFQKAANSVGAQIIGEVNRLKGVHKGALVKTTGHSLGAAMAQLTAMTLLKNGIAVDNMINFGAPRIGDNRYAAFSDSVFKNQWRVVHAADIVPHNPTSIWPINYYHTSTEIWEKPEKTYRVCRAGEDPKCCNSELIYLIDDHLEYMGRCMGELCGNCKSSS